MRGTTKQQSEKANRDSVKLPRLKNIEHYRFSKEFHDVCKPIFSSSPITFCSIGRLFRDGTYTSFMSDPVWTDLYLRKHYEKTLHLWLESEIQLRQSGYGIWSLSSVFTRHSDLQQLHADCAAFQYYNGINIVDTYPEYLEFIRFSSPKTEGVESYFLGHQDLLRQFILLIKEKIQEDKSLSAEYNSHYLLPNPLTLNAFDYSNQAQDVDFSSIKKFYLGFPLQEELFLTHSELRCLIPYIMGIPKNNIAERYYISVRTVEKHIENIQKKSVCDGLASMRFMFLENKFVMSLIPKIFSAFLN